MLFSLQYFGEDKVAQDDEEQRPQRGRRGAVGKERGRRQERGRREDKDLHERAGRERV